MRETFKNAGVGVLLVASYLWNMWSSSKIDPLSQSGNLWLIGSLVLTAALKIQTGHCKYSKKADISNVHPLSELLTLLNP